MEIFYYKFFTKIIGRKHAHNVSDFNAIQSGFLRGNELEMVTLFSSFLLDYRCEKESMNHIFISHRSSSILFYLAVMLFSVINNQCLTSKLVKIHRQTSA